MKDYFVLADELEERHGHAERVRTSEVEVVIGDPVTKSSRLVNGDFQIVKRETGQVLGVIEHKTLDDILKCVSPSDNGEYRLVDQLDRMRQLDPNIRLFVVVSNCACMRDLPVYLRHTLEETVTAEACHERPVPFIFVHDVGKGIRDIGQSLVGERLSKAPPLSGFVTVKRNVQDYTKCFARQINTIKGISNDAAYRLACYTKDHAGLREFLNSRTDTEIFKAFKITKPALADLRFSFLQQGSWRTGKSTERAPAAARHCRANKRARAAVSNSV